MWPVTLPRQGKAREDYFFFPHALSDQSTDSTGQIVCTVAHTIKSKDKVEDGETICWKQSCSLISDRKYSHTVVKNIENHSQTGDMIY